MKSKKCNIFRCNHRHNPFTHPNCFTESVKSKYLLYIMGDLRENLQSWKRNLMGDLRENLQSWKRNLREY
jgi:hypothetical protein